MSNFDSFLGAKGTVKFKLLYQDISDTREIRITQNFVNIRNVPGAVKKFSSLAAAAGCCALAAAPIAAADCAAAAAMEGQPSNHHEDVPGCLATQEKKIADGQASLASWMIGKACKGALTGKKKNNQKEKQLYCTPYCSVKIFNGSVSLRQIKKT